MRLARYLIAPRYAVFDLLWMSPAISLIRDNHFIAALCVCVAGVVFVGLLRLAIEKLSGGPF